MSAKSLPDDDTLTSEGLAADGDGKLLLLACGALAREILVVLERNALTHIDLQCLPAIYHNHPERIVPAVRAAVDEHRSGYERIFVVYADCGTGGLLQAAADEMGVEIIPGPHCYAFFEGTDGFIARAEDEFTAFYLTDFLVRQFDAFVWKPLGLDRHPELRDMYFGNYTRVIYLAQTDNPDLDAKAEAAAVRLGLGYERRFTGYGELASVLAGL